MRQISFESVGIFRPVCPARPAAARFRRAFAWPILTRPPIRATQPCSLLQISIKTVSRGMNTDLFTGKESLTKKKKNFPLELRAKTGLIKQKINPELGFAHIVLNSNRGLAGTSTP